MAHDGKPVGDMEKETSSIHHVDKQNSNSIVADGDSSDVDHGFSEQEQRSIIKRIDRRLVLMVGTLYCVSLMDRVNMSSANIAGMGKDLVLTGTRYVCIFGPLLCA